MNIKCIFIDIDGTLLDDKKNISDYTKNVIKQLKEKNIKVILISGRCMSEVIEISKKCNASSIIISDNGSVIYDYNAKKYLFEKKFSYKSIKEIWDMCIKYNIDSIYNSKNIRYRKYINLDLSFNKVNDLIIDNYSEISENVFQTVLLSFDNVSFYNCINKLKNKEFNISNFGKGKNGIFFADVNLKNSSKGMAICHFCKKCNISQNETMCFGNSINDLDMFENCEISVAMKNGIGEILKKSNYITEYSNNDNGLAKFLEKYFNL